VAIKFFEFFDKIKSNSFYKSTITLSFTSLLAQLIILLGTPLITRLYSPSDFADLSIISALIQFFGVFATLRYDNAIPLCDSDNEADILFIFCTLFIVGFSFLLFLIIVVLETFGVNLFNFKNQSYIYFVPIGVSLFGFANLLSFFSIRVNLYKTLGVSRVLQSFTSVSFQIGLGYTKFSIIGPILGYLFQIGFSTVYMFKTIWSKIVLIRQGKFGYENSKKVLEKFIRFPKYSLLEALMQMFSIQLPFFFLNYINDQSESGYLLNSMKFSQIPIVLVASSISQVYYGYIKENLNNGKLQIMSLDIIIKLYNFIILPLIVFIPISPYVFETYLGNKWRHSGELMQWIIPYTIALIIFAIFSVNFYAKEKFAQSLKIQFVILLFRGIALLIGYLFFKNIALEIFFIASAFIYFLFSYYALNVINFNWKEAFLKIYSQKEFSIVAFVLFSIFYFLF
jgi:O-antigen/teichoic acid export membrane protein